ncbi:hypothetical protein DFH08DRAFT_679658 [Mycena albidolilacea]|uniref:DEAD/DEAH-box helicase domain-containing protein n=1 Tax=Mycena albidolilacea TaxID=1033008 RepID=A0AAD7F2U0_9AGAR|nr:hypothetical protein DFH08DRAFT_679658 [Mycena albidolilacea]
MKKLIPAWKDGLRGVQEDLASARLGGDDILCCTATGDGKSAAFSVPFYLGEVRNPVLYPAGLPTRSNPVGIVVTPTKGLAANIVSAVNSPSNLGTNGVIKVLELTRLAISAFAFFFFWSV